jgi:hypothetical protein
VNILALRGGRVLERLAYGPSEGIQDEMQILNIADAANLKATVKALSVSSVAEK